MCAAQGGSESQDRGQDRKHGGRPAGSWVPGRYCGQAGGQGRWWDGGRQAGRQWQTEQAPCVLRSPTHLRPEVGVIRPGQQRRHQEIRGGGELAQGRSADCAAQAKQCTDPHQQAVYRQLTAPLAGNAGATRLCAARLCAARCAAACAAACSTGCPEGGGRGGGSAAVPGRQHRGAGAAGRGPRARPRNSGAPHVVLAGPCTLQGNKRASRGWTGFWQQRQQPQARRARYRQLKCHLELVSRRSGPAHPPTADHASPALPPLQGRTRSRRRRRR